MSLGELCSKGWKTVEFKNRIERVTLSDYVAFLSVGGILESGLQLSL